MSEQYRDIRKEVNLTADELKQIEKMMEVDNYRHFSSFVRDKILMTDDKLLRLPKNGFPFGSLKSLNRSVEMCIWF
ncbi:Tn5252%2C Orf 10 protein [Streptococcus pneumoniae]|nr:Tn5252, Orf 10 protein [Streptococcus pneumoniae]VTQ35068.1 Uncharacterised protein [Haemophilus haemolyticus]CVQ17150.1 Tn5252%2C Orf 10 protein [Streptococcus pneumoniae]CVR91377.1 Tn5252%2C Orf 10 protein [Streptococcus pneumoniae]CVV55484.1 Tn5252%2C Orf 10 protein [Streptococcus pneumoniae]